MCLLEAVHRARTLPVGGNGSVARAVGTNLVMSANFVLNLLLYLQAMLFLLKHQN